MSSRVESNMRIEMECSFATTHTFRQGQLTCTQLGPAGPFMHLVSPRACRIDFFSKPGTKREILVQAEQSV